MFMSKQQSPKRVFEYFEPRQGKSLSQIPLYKNKILSGKAVSKKITGLLYLIFLQHARYILRLRPKNHSLPLSCFCKWFCLAAP